MHSETANVVPSSPNLVTLIMVALSSTETSVTRRNIPEEDIHHNHRREKLKSYSSNLTILEFVAK
jgi:hypothetical protein